MKRLRPFLILSIIICAFGFSCKKPDVPVVNHTNLSLELAFASAKTAKITITYSDGEPYYVRIMKCVGYDTITSAVDINNSDALTAYMITHSTIAALPKTINITGLETLKDYVIGAVAFNVKNEVIDAQYLIFQTKASEDSIGDEGGAGEITIVTL
jgi:hypothetical protein